MLSPGARRVLAAIMSEIGEGDHAAISVNSHGGIPANRNPRMRLPRIDRFAYQLWNDRVHPKCVIGRIQMSEHDNRQLVEQALPLAGI